MICVINYELKGEKMRQWTTIDPVTFCDLVTEFLHSHPSPSGSSQSLDDLNFMRKSTVEKVSKLFNKSIVRVITLFLYNSRHFMMKAKKCN